MPDKVAQFAFEFSVEPRFEAEDFLVSESNAAAYDAIEAWPGWPDPVHLLVGPAGAGKSHLAAIFAARAHAWVVGASEVTSEDVTHLSSSGALVVEDADRSPLDEAAWFHLLNRVRAQRGALLVTARTPPDAWGVATPDLLSRLRLAPMLTVAGPDDALLRAVLVKLFLDRQLVVDTAVIEAIVRRAERSIPALATLVDELDRAALAAKRRVTAAFVAQMLMAGGKEQ